MDFKMKLSWEEFWVLIILNDKYKEISEEEFISEQPVAVALNLDTSENENPTNFGLDWNEV